MTPRITAIPYHEDGAALFERVRARPWPAFLDSGPPHARRGRFDIIAAEPEARVVTRAGRTTVCGRGADEVAADPLQALRRLLGPRTPHVDPWPFAGGAIGYVGYDTGRLWEPLASAAAVPESVPELAAGVYGWAVVVDHALRRAALITQPRSTLDESGRAALLAALHAADVPAPPRPLVVRGPLRANMTREEYRGALGRIARYIRDGDAYQINFSQRFDAEVSGDPWEFYLRLRRRNPAPYAAFLQLPFACVMSASPEAFLTVRGRHVITRPIKGTRPRDADPARDRALARELAHSAKDRAENLMIVDLLRNDLGKTCAIGTVRVPRLFEVESYASVHHLVSTVEGELAPGRDALDLLRGCFPGGSITGAPKRRAMEIIDELEPHRRGVHYGAIGYVGCDGAMELNVAIRTLVVADGSIRFWAGGGIVADSDPDAEYQECLDKVAPMLELLATGAAPGAVHRGTG